MLIKYLFLRCNKIDKLQFDEMNKYLNNIATEN